MALVVVGESLVFCLPCSILCHKLNFKLSKPVAGYRLFHLSLFINSFTITPSDLKVCPMLNLLLSKMLACKCGYSFQTIIYVMLD